MSDDSETVYVRTNQARDTREVFHTNEDCRYLPEDYRLWDREDAEGWMLRECRNCADNILQGPKSHDHYRAAVKADPEDLDL